MSAQVTLTEVAGDALVHATETFKRQPMIVEVLFAFALVTALLLHRGGRAVRSGEGERAIHRDTIDDLWPDLERGIKAYLRSATITVVAKSRQRKSSLEKQ
jgi:hypothetical protein